MPTVDSIEDRLTRHWAGRFILEPGAFPNPRLVPVKSPRGQRMAMTWSGGKDTCFALYQALADGFEVKTLASFFSSSTGFVAFHGVTPHLLRIQARGLQMPLRLFDVSKDFLKQVRRALLDLRRDGCTTLGMGYFDPTEQRRFIHFFAGQSDMNVYEPLCQRDQREVLVAMLDAGFNILVSSVQLSSVDPVWLGRRLDHRFLKYLDNRPSLSPCGELGEFHTIVVDGPIFKRRLKIDRSVIVESSGYRHLFVERVELTKKHP